MKFYKIVHDFDLEDGWVLGKILGDGIYIPSVEQLEKHQHLSSTVTHISNPVSFTFAHPNIPIISRELYSILDIPGETELLPVDIVDENDVHFEDYYAIKILKELDCINREESVYNLFTADTHPSIQKHGTYRNFSKLVIDEYKTEEASIFKLKGYTTITVINKVLKRKLESKRVQGIKIIEL